MVKSRDHEALRRCLTALHGAAVPLREQAAAFGVSDTTLAKWRRKTGVVRLPLPAEPDLPGEQWRDRPDLRISVSSSGRFRSLVTGRLLKITAAANARFVSIADANGRRTTSSVQKLISQSFGGEFGVPEFIPAQRRALNWSPWTVEEIAALREVKTFKEAYAAVPTRTVWAVRKQVAKMDLKLSKAGAKPSKTPRPRRQDGPIKGSVPFLDPLWSEAHRAVPRGLVEDVRDDLIAEMVLLRLEGDTAPMADLFKQSYRARNRMFDHFKTRSLDAPLPGTDGLRLIDCLDTEGGIW